MKKNRICIFFSFFVFFIFVFIITIYSSTPIDSTSSVIMTKTNVDSQSVNQKISKAPIVVFSVLGAFIGGVIGHAVDPPKKALEGELEFNTSNGELIGCATGFLVGGYVGYLLAKRDAKHDKEESRKRKIEKPSNKSSARKNIEVLKK